MKRLIHTLTATALLLSLSSCERRPLETLAEGLSLILVNDYSLPCEPAPTIPQIYRVNMYDSRSGDLIFRDYVPEEGGRMRFLPGDFTCFVHGYEDGILTVENENDANAFHVTAPGAGKEAETLLAECRSQTDGSVSTEPLIRVSDCFWAGAEAVRIPVLTDTDVEYTITVRNSAVLSQGRITLCGIKGIGNIASTECFVTNLAAGLNPISAKLDEASVTEIFPLKVQKDSVSSAFFFFGRTARQKEQGQMLYVVITDRDGGLHHFCIDLKNIEPEGDMVYTVWLDTVIPGEGDKEFHLDVDEWGEETQNIPMKN